MPSERIYRKPHEIYIGSEAKALYRHEESRNEAIEKTAQELQKLLELPDLWRDAMPQALFDILNGFETGASIAASTAFLEKQGFTITKNA